MGKKRLQLEARRRHGSMKLTLRGTRESRGLCVEARPHQRFWKCNSCNNKNSSWGGQAPAFHATYGKYAELVAVARASSHLAETVFPRAKLPMNAHSPVPRRRKMQLPLSSYPSDTCRYASCALNRDKMFLTRTRAAFRDVSRLRKSVARN